MSEEQANQAWQEAIADSPAPDDVEYIVCLSPNPKENLLLTGGGEQCIPLE